MTVASDVLLPIGLVVVMTLFAILLSFSMATMSCHRMFLGRVPDTSRGWVVFRMSDFRFASRLLLIWLITAIIGLPVMIPLALTEMPWLAMVAGIPAIYLFGRMSPSLPAAAVGDATTIADAWELGQGNGWRLAVLVVFQPFATSWLRDVPVPADASAILTFLFRPLFFLVLIFEICVLSLAYRALCEAADAEEPEPESSSV